MAAATSASEFTKADVAIIGGGLAGLTTAMGLRESGLRVALFEKSARLGGRASSVVDEQTGDTVDIGPHILLRSLYPNFDRLCAELGTAGDVVWQPETFIHLVEGQRHYQLKMARWPAPLHLLPWLVAHEHVSALDHLSNAAVTLLTMQLDERDFARLDHVNARALLRRMGVTRRYMEQYWEFICISIMNVPIELCSAGALLRFYQVMVGRNSYRSGFARRGLGNLFAPGAERLLAKEGHLVVTDTPIASIDVDSERATGLTLADGRRITARYVVAALPPRELHDALPEPVRRTHAGFRKLVALTPCPYVSVYLWFDRQLTDLRFWARPYHRTSLNTDFYDLSNIDTARRQRGSLIASNMIYAHRVRDWSDEQVLAATLDELAEFLPSARDAALLHHRIHRIPMGIPCPFPGTDSLRLPTRSPLRGLYLAGDWTQTHLPWSMESAARSGWLAAEAILADAGHPAKLALELDRSDGLAGLMAHLGRLRPSRLERVLADPAGKAGTDQQQARRHWR